MNYIGVYTIAKKEVKRSLKVPVQMVGTPVVTTVLYFLIFGFAVGARIGQVSGLSYIEFIVPGLIMMNVLTTAFTSMAFGIMFPRIVGRTINDLLISPMSHLEILAGFTIASVLRCMIIGILIFLTAQFFIPFRLDHAIFLIPFTALVGTAFSFFGFIIGLTSKNFEQVSIFPTFVIMPLSFLGGIFYSLDMLPPFAQAISHYNPIFYMINGMRYGFYGITDVSPHAAVWMTLGVVALFFAIVWRLLHIGHNLRS